MDRKKLSQGVCHVINSPFPGGGGNCIIEGHNLAEFGFWKPQILSYVMEW
jgi:sortase (surface protein transpeptidase)